MKVALRIVALIFSGLVCTVIAMIPFVPALPSITSPDLLAALCCFWVMRRPETAPLPVIFLLGLAADLLLMRPVGLGALVLVLMTEALRTQVVALRDVSRFVEWMIFAAFFTLATLGMLGVIWVTFAEVPPLGAMAQRIVLTVACYPLVGVVVRVLFGVTRRTASGVRV
ncbi:rod shape-determining protein MreD [Pontivivens insulae]|uniref:Rod shape-determining protein MreD n=1 Tax=Pontivivens insulae TaxID=1639689 RepID=A0A2R8A842_9RHOB|nr:hypothetical protein [Pontivivens insulae]RED18300.1 rod shape-determining protein MreD [Pontivivens insulae]SPF28198.1 hypothetical protein POI8812_00496 [Pontivivens insulae]